MATTQSQRGAEAASWQPCPRRQLPALALWLAGLAVAIGCGSDLDPKRSDARYACATTADCTTGDSCVCGFCQPLSVTPSCLASSGGGSDAGSDAAADSASGDAVTVDAGDTGGTVDTSDTQDTTGGPCSPRTWQGCPAGDGCYVDAKGGTSCLKTGNLGLDQPCDPQAAQPPCGKDGAKPLICDVVDKKCLHLCDASKPVCAKGLTCYPLGSPAWPDNAGVCAL